MGWLTCHPKHSTSTKQAKKNETAAGVALVLTAAVGFTGCVSHQLLGEEGVGELHQLLVAPVPDRRPAARTSPLMLILRTGFQHPVLASFSP